MNSVNRKSLYLPLRRRKPLIAPSVYKTMWKKKRHTYVKHVIVWRDASGDHREAHSDPAVAKRRASEIGICLANGETSMLSMTQADRVELQCARKHAAPAGQGVVSIIVRFGVMAARLPAGHTFEEVFGLGLKHIPAAVDATVPDLVAEYSRRHPASEKWSRNRDKMLARFAAAFMLCPISLISPAELDQFLDRLPGGLRTRRNHRSCVSAVIEFARARGQLAGNPLEGVSDPAPRAVEVNLYTPEELVSLLNRAEASRSGRRLLPLLCLAAFCGLRHEEIRRLDWSDLDWKSARCYVPGPAAKTGRARVVDMPDNLLEWLDPFCRPRGPICDLANSSNALCRLRAAAGILGRKRNAIRKSWITYRVALSQDIAAVAGAAGNSPQIVRQFYNLPGTRTRETAARWFAIRPTRAEMLPLWQHVQKL